MHKNELIEAVSTRTGLTKSDTLKFTDAIIDVIFHSLKNSQRITLIGFGYFQVTNRSSRNGRNPRTGETIKIQARKIPRFTAAKVLKDAINS